MNEYGVWKLKPWFSEFTYGFCLSQEILRKRPPNSAPVVPSLPQEARKPYDIKLSLPSAIVCLQFKLPVATQKRSNKEIAAGIRFSTKPFYRFDLYHYLKPGQSKKSKTQHELLLRLDRSRPASRGSVQLFYAAPFFHTRNDLDRFFLAAKIESNSVFCRVRNLPSLKRGPHAISYDNLTTGYCFSDAAEVRFAKWPDIATIAVRSLSGERAQPLGAILDQILRIFSRGQFGNLPRRLSDYRRRNPNVEADIALLQVVGDFLVLELGVMPIILQFDQQSGG